MFLIVAAVMPDSSANAYRLNPILILRSAIEETLIKISPDPLHTGQIVLVSFSSAIRYRLFLPMDFRPMDFI